jgi:hypothetical protein
MYGHFGHLSVRALNESDFDHSGKLRQTIPLRRIKTGPRHKPVTLSSF